MQQALRDQKETLVDETIAKKRAEEEEEEKCKAAEAEEEAKKKEQKKAADAISSMGMGMDAIFTKEARSKRITTSLKKAVVGDKAKVQQEEVHMINSIKRRQKIKSGQVEAVRSIRFTVGTEETSEFERKNVKLAADGLPHFKRLEKGIGLHTQICIWIEKTIDQDEFLTRLELSHTDPSNDNYKDLKRKGLDCVEHDMLKGASVSARVRDSQRR